MGSPFGERLFLRTAVIDNTRQPQMSDMITLLNDLSYIPPNNKHNEPTQEILARTSNEQTQATRKLTDSIFNEMLEFFQNIFPISKGYKLPPSYYAIKKTFKTIRLGYELIHACEHDCCLFRGKENKDLDFCPVSNTSRWKDSNTPRKKVPKKVLRYFSIIPRLQRLYKSSHTAKEMIWHVTEKYTEPGEDIDVYLRPLIEDLKVLWDWKGVESIDVASGQKVQYESVGFIDQTMIFLLEVVCLGGVARQDLKGGHSKWLVARPNKNKKCLKPHALYSFTPENRKKFCQFIKGVKLPDGFESCFKHKVTDNDTNIWAGSLMTQICSATLMEDDMLKAQIKVVDILCDLELIYPPALFDIMIHLVIYLPLEALEGGPIRPRWMFPFERYMKKLKGYVRNKAKPEGSIAKGYVAEEALTFSSHYFWDVTIKFNHPDRNVDPPPPNVSVLGVPIGIPEINMYRSQFKSLFPNKNMKEEFPDWFGLQIRQRHIDNDKDLEVSTTSELFALACGPMVPDIH
ncbi:hypothetical protein Tco_1439174 [Tanacetum coccineum]